MNATYISRALRLTLLAPDMVEAILHGRQPDGMTLPKLMEGVTVEWEGQLRRFLAPSPPVLAGGWPRTDEVEPPTGTYKEHTHRVAKREKRWSLE